MSIDMETSINNVRENIYERQSKDEAEAEAEEEEEEEKEEEEEEGPVLNFIQ